MKEEKRMNQGYEIMESCTIGNKELVIGHNEHAPNPYVCWYCKNRRYFYWGHYCNTLKQAQEKFKERCQEERNDQCDTKQPPPKKKDSHER